MMSLFELLPRKFNQNKILKLVTRDFYLDLNPRVTNSKSYDFQFRHFHQIILTPT